MKKAIKKTQSTIFQSLNPNHGNNYNISGEKNQ